LRNRARHIDNDRHHITVHNGGMSCLTNMNGPTTALCHTSRTDARVVATASRGSQYRRQLIDQGHREHPVANIQDTALKLVDGWRDFCHLPPINCYQQVVENFRERGFSTMEPNIRGHADCQPGRRLYPFKGARRRAWTSAFNR